MRVQVPKDFSEENVTVTANALFVHFANDFASFINDYMTSRNGPTWLQDLQVEDMAYRNFNPKDPAALLKDLARYGGSKLRPALNTKIERGFLKDYYDGLDDLLGERNAWLHRQVPETKASLLDLLTSLLRVGRPLGLAIVEDCKVLQKSILDPEPVAPPLEASPSAVEVAAPAYIHVEEIPVEVPIGSLEVQPLPDEVQEKPVTELAVNIQDLSDILVGENHQIGDVVTDQLLSHSYVLHLNGDIRDRASNELLSAFNSSAAQSLGPLLIARKPCGGRVRITEEGLLCAFFGEKWGYLAQVKSEDWFPNHLQKNVKGN